jgi:hypothetical protein
VQQLGHDQVRDLVVDRCAEKDDPVLEQARVDIEGGAGRPSADQGGWAAAGALPPI